MGASGIVLRTSTTAGGGVVACTGRPTYPTYNLVFKFHDRAKGALWDTAVDIGYGTGTSGYCV